MKKTIAICLVLGMLLGLMPTAGLAADASTIILTADSFQGNLGTWKYVARESGAALSNLLRSPGGGRPENTQPAEVTIEVEEAGTYFVWVRSRDYVGGVDTSGNPIKSGVRLCKVQVGNTTFEKEFGAHGTDGFEWEEAGSVSLPKGNVTVRLIDSSANYARVEAICLSTDEHYKLPTDSNLVKAAQDNAPKTVSTGTAGTSQTAQATAAPQGPQGGTTPANVVTHLMSAESFSGHLGTWLLTDKPDAGSFGPILRSTGGQKPADKTNAILVYKETASGKFYVWARTRDYGDGARSFKIAVDKKLMDVTLGKHGADAFVWEYCGEIELAEGNVQVDIVDSGANYGRMEAVVITNDPNYRPPETASDYQSALMQFGAPTVRDPNLEDAISAEEASKVVSKSSNAGQTTLKLQEDHFYTVITPDIFAQNLGSWSLSPVNMNSELPAILMAKTDHRNYASTPAAADIVVPRTDVYKVLVHSYDQPVNSGRPFEVWANDTILMEVGAHGQNWKWDSADVLLEAGDNQILLKDTKANYGRMDLVVVTDDLDFEVTEDTSANILALLDYTYKPGSVTVETEADPNRPNDDVAVKMNGAYMTFEVPPAIINDRTMVPFRAIFEALNCVVDWDADTRTAIGIRNGKKIELPIDSEKARISGETVFLDAPATIINDRTLVPLRFVSEALGAQVAWDGATRTVTIYAQIPATMLMLTGISYYDIGTWTLEGTQNSGFACGNLRGITPDPAIVNATQADADPSKTKPATARLEVTTAGKYNVWVHARDYATNQQGSRFFNVGVNGKMLPKKAGQHGKEGYAWELIDTVDLNAGDNTFELYDTSGFYARCDMVILCDDLDYVPSDTYEVLLGLAAPVDASGLENPVYPQYAKELGEPVDSAVLENGNTKVVFYKVPTSGGQVVQQEIYSLANGQWVLTTDRSDELGYIALRADESSLGTLPQDMYVFNSKYQLNGKDASYMGTELYRAGIARWFIPTDYTVSEDGKVILTAANDYGTLQAVWELVGDSASPKVTVNTTFNDAGVYTVGTWEGEAVAKENFSYAMAPFRVQGKRVHAENGLLTQQYLFTPMACYTLPETNRYAQGNKITKGIVAEPSWINPGWVYRNYGQFGLSMKSPDGLYRGGMFAPVLGTPESNIAAGGSYSFQYRVISSASDWFDNYKFVAQELFKVNDYRQNTYATLNEAIFNTRELMLTDAAGWDDNDKGYWNEESQNTTTAGNMLEAMQVYLLTENQEYLEKRTIPTIAALMTRGRVQFNSRWMDKSNGYVTKEQVPHTIGNFITGYNMNVLGGAYEMSMGRVPYILNTAVTNAKAGKVNNTYSQVVPYANDLYLYKYTGEQQYLTAAKEKADQYLKDEVYAMQDTPVDFGAFIYISYYPNIAPLVDLFEITGEQKYLDAAKYTAEQLVSTLWVPGIDSDKKDATVTANDFMGQHYGLYHSWKGAMQEFIGYDLINNDYREEVPAWMVSRVGLGLEQASTFYGSGNIYMSPWAGDLLRLAKYTGEEYFATAAKNAIIGRFANYPGYYVDKNLTITMKKDYPYYGPDENGIYYHHIPPFLSMLEDFIINLAFYESDGAIDFPAALQQGYAYFNNNQYGFKPGKFFDEQDMWLWLDDGVLDTGNLQIDWLGVKKDGKVGFAFMNESAQDVTTTVSLLDKIPGGSTFSGTATVYDAAGNKSETAVADGKLTITVPAKGLSAVVIPISGVKAPAYASLAIDYSTDVKDTVCEHTNGKAIVLQMDPDKYYAYVYVTDAKEEGKTLTLTYQIGSGQKQTVTSSEYPYEFIVPVYDASQPFSYTLDVKGASSYSTSGKIAPKK